MASTDAFVGAMQRLIDSLEDAGTAASSKLVEAISSIDARAWMRLAMTGEIEAISTQIGIEVTRELLPLIESAALDAASTLSGRNARARIPVAGRSGSRLFGPESGARVAQRTASLVSDELTTAQNRIVRLVRDVPPNTAESARVLLDRIDAEVLAPMRQASRWQEPVNHTSMTSGNEALSSASVRLRSPEVPPDAAHQAALDAPHAWVCALVRTCPDCLPRHGQVDTALNWRRRGVPRSGWSACRGHCRCQLVPVFDGSGSLDVPSHAALAGPLQREKMHLIAEGTPRGLTVAVPKELLSEEPGALRSKDQRREAIRKAYESDIRVRRAMRILGSLNAGGE